MVNAKESVIPMLEVNYKKLSNTEKKIADFFLSNEEDIDVSSKEIAKKLFVSEATLSRFAQKCGFSGYREFAYIYKNQHKRKPKIVTDSYKSVFSLYKELLEKEYEFIDEKQIDRIAQYMGQKERVYVCGKGSSGIAAEEMELRFMRVGININSIVHADRMHMQAVFTDKNCLVMGFSISGNTEAVLYMLKTAHKNGSKTVLVTSFMEDSFKSFCDEVILVPSVSRMYCGNSISPQFPLLVLQDLLYMKYKLQNQFLKETFHENTVLALAEERDYENI